MGGTEPLQVGAVPEASRVATMRDAVVDVGGGGHIPTHLAVHTQGVVSQDFTAEEFPAFRAVPLAHIPKETGALADDRVGLAVAALDHLIAHWRGAELDGETPAPTLTVACPAD